MLRECLVSRRLAASRVSGRAGIRLIQQNPDIPDLLHRVLDGVLGVLRWYLQPISEVPPRFNCIEAETITKLLAQLAHMALDYALIERGFEYAVDRVEDLRLREPFPVVANHILDDAQFAARQGTAANFRIAPVKEDPDAAFAWAREIPKVRRAIAAVLARISRR